MTKRQLLINLIIGATGEAAGVLFYWSGFDTSEDSHASIAIQVISLVYLHLFVFGPLTLTFGEKFNDLLGIFPNRRRLDESRIFRFFKIEG